MKLFQQITLFFSNTIPFLWLSPSHPHLYVGAAMLPPLSYFFSAKLISNFFFKTLITTIIPTKIMEILTKRDVEVRKNELISRVKDGAIFIYPTDTIYGIVCDATNGIAIQKLRELKKRPIDKALSVWAPNKKWIEENCDISSDNAKEYLPLLPGKYTLLIPLKNKKAIAKNVAPSKEFLGVRLPNHWFNSFINDLEVPIITTSVNKSSEPFMTSIDDLDPRIGNYVDFIISVGEIKNKPSKIVNCKTKQIINR